MEMNRGSWGFTKQDQLWHHNSHKRQWRPLIIFLSGLNMKIVMNIHAPNIKVSTHRVKATRSEERDGWSTVIVGDSVPPSLPWPSHLESLWGDNRATWINKQTQQQKTHLPIDTDPMTEDMSGSQKTSSQSQEWIIPTLLSTCNGLSKRATAVTVQENLNAL